ncbi:MAG TPA: hypothetical protein VND65_05100 [Candidatus Binatia bacterium]|nr:hypothetical protein [Candidatus Binatia bacterium]
MRWECKCRWLAVTAVLWGLGLSGEAAGQAALGQLHASANGQLQSLYSGTYGNLPGTDTHSLGFEGRGIINGDYYTPNFLSFSLFPYYGRSQANSDMQSITDASGYNGTVNFFKGSHFPGVFTANQDWNNTGNFGIPGITGLATRNNDRGLNIDWSALLPGFPAVTVGFGDSAGNSSLLGSQSTTDSTNKNFHVLSTYNLNRYFLSAGFIHLTNHVDFNGLEDGSSETTQGSSNQYRFMIQGPVPYRQSSMSLNLNRSSYNTEDSNFGTNYGTTDTVNGNVNLMFPRAPVSVTSSYTDNLLGSIEQQLVSSGEVPLAGLSTPESRSFTVGASTFVNVLPRLMVGGFVNRTEQFFAGQNFGLTQVGLTVNYNFLHSLKGLTFYGGVNYNASQTGNSRLGFIGNIAYNRYFGKWQINSFFLYNQNTQTILVVYTTSTLNYGATLRRQINPDLSWSIVTNFIKSGFEQTKGNSNSGGSVTAMLIGRKASVSTVFSKSSGTALLTSAGLVSTTLPSQVYGPNATVLFSGESYGGNVSFYPIRHMIVSTSWSKSIADTNSPLLLSMNGNTNYYGFAGYEFRKLLFQAGMTRFNQSISNSGTPASMLTSYSFGISRWFKGF